MHAGHSIVFLDEAIHSKGRLGCIYGLYARRSITEYKLRPFLDLLQCSGCDKMPARLSLSARLFLAISWVAFRILCGRDKMLPASHCLTGLFLRLSLATGYGSLWSRQNAHPAPVALVGLPCAFVTARKCPSGHESMPSSVTSVHLRYSSGGTFDVFMSTGFCVHWWCAGSIIR